MPPGDDPGGISLIHLQTPATCCVIESESLLFVKSG